MRELGRKERATAEANRVCNRYPIECGPVVTYKVPVDGAEKYLDGGKIPDEYKIDCTHT